MKKTAVLLLLAVLLCLVSCDVPVPAEPAKDVRVIFVNVGKADAALVLADGHTALIDTGTKESVPRLIGTMNALGIEKIDALFLTHTHKDHTGGAEAVCRRFDVGRLYFANYTETDKDGSNVIFELADAFSLDHTRLSCHDTVTLTNGVTFEAIGPVTLNTKDDNDNSLVLRLKADGITYLFAGDMQVTEEKTLLGANVKLKADVLKVGNHGNPDATGVLFAAKVNPSVAVISTDTEVDTDSAHPDVLKALAGADVYLTQDHARGIVVSADEKGAVSVSDLTTEKAPPVGVVPISADKSTETVVLSNPTAADADLSGCMLSSAESGKTFFFEVGTVLRAGDTLTVVWDEKNPIKKDDTITLYDRFGDAVSSISS